MTPREELEKNITEALNEDYTGTTSDIAIGELEGFAIGKWVSVEERLPRAVWEGCVKRDKSKPYINKLLQWRKSPTWEIIGGPAIDGDPTHWLDLSLPEQ